MKAILAIAPTWYTRMAPLRLARFAVWRQAGAVGGMIQTDGGGDRTQTSTRGRAIKIRDLGTGIGYLRDHIQLDSCRSFGVMRGAVSCSSSPLRYFPISVKGAVLHDIHS